MPNPEKATEQKKKKKKKKLNEMYVGAPFPLQILLIRRYHSKRQKR